MCTKCVLTWGAAAVAALTSSFALATTQRTFVAASGVDNSTCSLNSPCRTFAAAMNATNTNGEIIVLESAGYGPVTITKAVSIVAPSGIYGGISVFSGNGITINAPGATVVLRGLSINGQGGTNGILVQQAARVRIENCVVSNMGAQGIYHQATNGEVIVVDTSVRDNADSGVSLVAHDASITLDHVRSEHNQNVGFYIAPTPGSMQVSAVIVDSVFAYNQDKGIWADTVAGAETQVSMIRSEVSRNRTDGFLTNVGFPDAFSTVTLTNSAFHGNTAGAHIVTTFGTANVIVADNSFGENFHTVGMLVEGGGSFVYPSRNKGGEVISCYNGATALTYQDNSLFIAGCVKIPRNTE